MRLLIRADTSVTFGTGHLMRCIALGQAWQDAGADVELLTSSRNAPLLNRANREGFCVRHIDADDEWAAIEHSNPRGSRTAVVLDGYSFDLAYQRKVREICRPLIVIDDDAHLSGYVADLLLNQNWNAFNLQYACESYTRKLMGPRWALLRREFRRLQGWKRPAPHQVRRILVTMGGSDPGNATATILEGILFSKLPQETEVLAVVGSENPYLTTIQNIANRSARITVQPYVEDMSQLMMWADLAIIAGGSTCWETAFLGLPCLLVILADNQRGNVAGMEAAGAGVSLGSSHELTPRIVGTALERLANDQAKMLSMSERASAVTNGSGAEAVVTEIMKLF